MRIVAVADPRLLPREHWRQSQTYTRRPLGEKESRAPVVRKF